MKTQIEKIDGDTWRPGWPKQGWIVRYDLSESHGWLCAHAANTLREAKAFAAQKEADN